jgi:hypothetical protein
MTSNRCTGPIYSWRNEEVSKVWCHELLHRSCIDAGLGDRTVCLGSLLQCKGSLAEAYVETWALLWDLGCALLERDPNVSLADAVVALNRERVFASKQAARIYHQMTLHGGHETTNTTAYYLLKALFLHDLEHFWKVSPEPSVTPDIGELVAIIAPHKENLPWTPDQNPPWGASLRLTAHRREPLL